jgi:hypothetical protein
MCHAWSTYAKKGTGISQWKVAHNLLSNTACDDDVPEEVPGLAICYHNRALMDVNKAHTGFLRRHSFGEPLMSMHTRSRRVLYCLLN